MRRLVLITVCVASLFATAAFAQAPVHANGGFGFHEQAAPLGVRWWLSGQKIGIDVGVGLGSDPSGIDPNENESHFAFDVGVPIVMHSWDGAHVLFRPGILYTSQEVGFDAAPGTPGIQFDTDNTTVLSIRAEIEGELFLRDNFSVSASNGIEFVNTQPADTNPAGPGPESTSSFGTIGRPFTEIGFHLYFLGGNQ